MTCRYTPSIRRFALGSLVVLLVLAIAHPLDAQDPPIVSQGADGWNLAVVDPPSPLKRFPTFEAVAPAPAFEDLDGDGLRDDPFENVSCSFDAFDGDGEVVEPAKGRYTTRLVVLDNNTGTSESFDIGSGKFNTKKPGGRRIILPPELTEIVPEGVDPGDEVSAWVSTRASFSNGKKAASAQVACRFPGNFLACDGLRDADGAVSQATDGFNVVSVDPPFQVKRFPRFESVVPMPAVLDTDGDGVRDDRIGFLCSFEARNPDLEGIKKAKGRYTTRLHVIDNNTGMGESFDVDSGKFRTNSDGTDQVEFDVPTEDFADGFESGELSVFVYTQANFSNNRIVQNAAVRCATAAREARECTF